MSRGDAADLLPDLTPTRARLAAAVLTLVGAVVVFLIASELFPYHSTNHDEGVYLQQAAMLLEGRLFLDPPVPVSFRPWFFVDEPQGHPGFVPGGDLYSKYSPVAPAMFAVGKLLGGYRVALALIAAGNVALTYTVVSEAFDRRHGLLAAGFLLASPLFLIDSSVFLAYAPTTLWNLLFALGYLRAERLGRAGEPGGPDDRRALRYAAVAGVGVALAFFARPYTAVLFATPFIGHAVWTLRGDAHRLAAREWRRVLDRAREGTGPLARNLVTGLFGLAGVAATLGYNAAVTGDPLLFPYRAFAPEDGLGFGHREILGYDRIYTPELALRANARVLEAFFTEWVAAGVLGSALAAVGLAWLLGRWHRSGSIDPRRLVVAGLFVSIAAGNVYFWGNLNILGQLTEPGDGLISFLGPYYHFDMLVPTAAFAAHGALALAGRLQAGIEFLLADRQARAVATAALLVGASVFGVVAVDAAEEPIEENRVVARQLSAAYQPFEGRPRRSPPQSSEARSYDGGLVFLPTPYGDWMNHPFQALRNDPGFDEGTVYALRENQFRVVDAFPNRTYYRYTYRGQWSPFLGTPVDPHVQRVEHVSGEQVRSRVDLGVPAGAERVSIRLASEEGSTYYATNGTPDTLSLTLHVEDQRAWVTGPVVTVGEGSIPIDDVDELLLTVFVDYGMGSGFSYRIELPTSHVDAGGDVRALTPYLEVCRVATRCGGEAAYIPSATRPGVSMNVSVRTAEE